MVPLDKKIFGAFLGAALGDAMGAATETRSIEMILRDFGGWVDTLVAPPNGSFACGLPAGSVTDDFSLAYDLAEHLIRKNGIVTEQMAVDALLSWVKREKYLRFAGPTTMAAINALGNDKCQNKESTGIQGVLPACDNSKATNGAAMKVFPIGLLHPGLVDDAVRDAAIVCLPTHKNDAAISGAAAIAAAVSEALTSGADMDSVIQAGIRGAVLGKKIGREIGSELAVPSVEKRIELAVSIARKSNSWESCLYSLRDIIGSGLAVYESVPCVFGILAYSGNDVFAAIKMGVNIGNDTDTVASMAGAVSGALFGVDSISGSYNERLDEINGFSISSLAKRFYKLVVNNMES